MRVLMLSRDASGLDPASATARRWRLLRDRDVELSVLVMSRRTGHWEEAGIRVVSSGGKNLISRLRRSFILANHELRDPKFDLITAQDPFELGWIAYQVSKKTKLRWEIQDHGGFFDGQKPDEPLWFLRGSWAWFLARRAHAIRTVSPGSMEKLAAAGLAGKTYFLSIAADEKFKAAVRHPEPFHLVSVGRLIPVKNFAFLIEVLSEIRKRYPEAHLTIVGDGPERKKLEKIAAAHGIGQAVHFPGRRDPLPYLEKAAVFVLLSRHEGWGIAAVEAALSGVPVIMSDTGCARFLHEKCGAGLVKLGSATKRGIADMIVAVCLQGSVCLPRERLDLPDRDLVAELQVRRWSGRKLFARLG